MADRTSQGVTGGLCALGAYGLWGVLPVFWKLLQTLPPIEIVANRILWSVLFTGIVTIALGRWPEVLETLRTPRRALPLLASGVLIALNWGIFIGSVASAHLVEASFGYYLNPLVNVALGMLLLGERLTRVQGIAIAVAVLGVVVLGSEQGGAVWISLALALSFGAYGLVHKLTPVSSVTALFLETAFLAPVALIYLGVLATRSEGALLHADSATRMLLVSTGIVTPIPLVLFASAARRLRFTTLGLFQYLSPTLSFLLAVFAYGEPFGRVRIAAFALIWTAVAIYSAGSLHSASRAWLAPGDEEKAA